MVMVVGFFLVGCIDQSTAKPFVFVLIRSNGICLVVWMVEDGEHYMKINDITYL